ncbi:MAG: Eco57I restriction-modification methylase domain-containing protein [Balneolaceae bacterium]
MREDDAAPGASHPHPDQKQASDRPSTRQRERENWEPYSELEVLPNIDINIKRGNSLVSRFGLDEDLSAIFKKSEHSLEDYKQAVRNYRVTRDRSEKQRLQKLIDDIKAEYSENLINNKPINKKLSDARAKFNALVNQGNIFGEKASKKEIDKAKKKLENLEKQKAEEEAGAFYREAFEWRFEFPEVLDDEGHYTGFDVVMGNPPYIYGRNSFDNNFKSYLKSNYETAQYQLDLYISFMELGIKILKSNSLISFITPNSWLKNLTFTKSRKFLLDNSDFHIIVPYLENVFEDANVDSLIFISKKSANNSQIQIDDYDKDEIFFHHFVDQNRFYQNENFLFDAHVTDKIKKILNKIGGKAVKMEELFEITRGVNAYDSYRGQSKAIIKARTYHADHKKDETFVPELKGKHVQPFYYGWNGNTFISYGDWLAAPRDPKFFNGERVILRQVTGDRLYCAFIDEEFITDQTVFIAKPVNEKTELNLKFVAGLISSLAYSLYFKYTLSQ